VGGLGKFNLNFKTENKKKKSELSFAAAERKAAPDAPDEQPTKTNKTERRRSK